MYDDNNFLFTYIVLLNLQEAGINKLYAKTVGISVDHRRTNKSVEAFQTNVNRLKEYKSRLVVFTKNQSTIDTVTSQNKDLFVRPKLSDSAFSTTVVTDELKGLKAYAALRKARADSKLVGIRLKKSKEEKKPAAAAAAGGDE